MQESAYLRMGDISEDLRPRERLALHGAASLSNAELVAILLRTGLRGCNVMDLAQHLIKRFGSLEELARAPVGELAKIKGIGKSKAVTLAAAFAIGARLARENAMRDKVDTPEAVYNLLGEEMRLLNREELRVLALNTRYHLVRVDVVSRGTVNESIAHPRDILFPLVTHSAYAFVLVHNHPSGDPTPSPADLRLTRRIAEAAGLMQIAFLDHVIIGSPDGGRQPFFSFKEAGQL